MCVVLVAAVCASCNWPVPSCETESGWRAFRYTPLEMTMDGTSYRFRGALYDSCIDICAKETGVIEVFECEPPKAPLDSGSGFWEVRCNVDAETCKLPSILKEDPTPFH